MQKCDTCKDCGKGLHIYINCTPTTMDEGVCSDCYIIRRNKDILDRRANL